MGLKDHTFNMREGGSNKKIFTFPRFLNMNTQMYIIFNDFMSFRCRGSQKACKLIVL